jgi:hypothetical protein
MTVVVHPTLETMQEVYQADGAGGANSERFRRYVEAGKNRAFVSGFNPMTKKLVLPVINSWRELSAESVAVQTATELLSERSIDIDLELFLTVATPGMWTDRIATAAEHVIAPKHPGEILLWDDDPPSLETLRIATQLQTIRSVFHHLAPPVTLDDFVSREGCAHQVSGDTGQPSERAEALLAKLGHQTEFGTIVAFLFGDSTAEHFGFAQLGLCKNEGTKHAAACAPPGHLASIATQSRRAP